MYCGRCGKWMERDTRFCPECEAAMNQPQAPVAPVPVPVQETYQQVPPHDAYQQVPPHDAYQQVPPQGNYYNPNYNSSAMVGYYYEPQPDPQNRMFGFGKALTATIIGFLSFYFMYFSIFMGAFDPESAFVFMLLATAPAIIALVLGIGSIKCFVARKDTCVKNIPTLVLGIAGTAFAGFALFFLVILFFGIMASL